MNIILTTHHYLSFVLLFIIAFVIFYIFSKKLLDSIVIKRLTFVIVSLLHFQFILGFFLALNYILLLWRTDFSFKEIIINKHIRYQIIEHPLIMLIAIILATIAHIHLKKNTYNKKKGAFLLLIAFICLLIRLPFKRLIS